MMSLLNAPIKLRLESFRTIFLWLVFNLCFIFPAATATAQTLKSPSPEGVKNRILQKKISDLYLSWNYYINGKNPPGQYKGPREGGPPDPKEVKKRLFEILPNQNAAVNNNPLLAVAYESRGSTFLGLYEITEDLNERASYAEKALVDFNKAIELEPARWETYGGRAYLLKLVDFFAYFNFVVSDSLKVIRLIDDLRLKKTSQASEYESKIHSYYMAIGNLYWNRGRALSQEPKLFEEVRLLNPSYSTYSIQSDFETALNYALKNITKASETTVPVKYWLDKGDAAYRSGDYQLSLLAYKSGKEYWDKNYSSYCAAIPSVCDNDKSYYEENFNLRLAKVYVKLENWEAALTTLNKYLARGRGCPEPYLVRAQVYRQLGQKNLALTDEQTARKLPSMGITCNLSEEQWK